ncbi:fungal-specific transcription factor domain-containing protein [Talaromyces proteolyticus]|uniref:Fungal-specific transcription factor domain-containing protein n=1 Tax=Talaromyces proteolyticus TaxID=1131652 RepID=A0AAD4PXV5_9EURO|nr:fungal-specific transcription factor domain-containing protein [Talaromyces proteolyticus]KAH8700460.1 fungal-specific transcription factor domain-containing protein [Talaromyces proteolyticus]
MSPDTTKISKACEPCRRRKIKCDGQEPCRNCQTQPLECVYRLKARVRIRKRVPKSSVHQDRSSDLLNTNADRYTSREDFSISETGTSRAEIYPSVAAADNAPQFMDSSQLFYGPSSNFAFLQQLHRSILLRGQQSHGQSHDFQEGGRGLDMFMQRNVFFGVPLRAAVPGNTPLFDLQSQMIPKALATAFLNNFKTSSLHILPFFNTEALDNLLDSLYSTRPDPSLQPHRRVLFLMVLAIGALSSTWTELADIIFSQAKQEAITREDSVTLSMIQFSLLVTDYQLNIGRPNSAYLHVGNACRKAFALGLNTASGNALLRQEEEIEERRTTLWCLYFYEQWVALTVGRKSMMREIDVLLPYPEKQTTLVNLCRFASIIEEAVEAIYSRRSESLRNLYTTAQGMYTKLRQYADREGIGSAAIPQYNTPSEAMSTLMLHNIYFHLVHTMFRPFLVAESTVQSGQTAELWLRQACRNATDAAADSIAFVSSMFNTIDVSKVRRYDSFCIEASCSVLLHDSLRHPSKHPNNLVYIRMALNCLGAMTDDEPVTNVAHSVERILSVVEQSISGNDDVSTSTPLLEAGMPLSPQHQTNILFPSLGQASSCAASNLIFLSNRQSQATNYPLPETHHGASQVTAEPLADLEPRFNFDVLATDLSTYFPLDIYMDQHSGQNAGIY